MDSNVNTIMDTYVLHSWKNFYYFIFTFLIITIHNQKVIFKLFYYTKR